MKFLKKLAIFTMALTLCFGAGLTLTACGGGADNESSNGQTTAAYTFIVLNKDGSAAKDINVQLCALLGQKKICYDPIATDANGKVTYNPSAFPGEGEYEIHLLDSSMMNTLEFTGPVSTPTVFGEITLTLK